MIGIIVGVLIVAGFFYIGIQGFSFFGLPLTSNKRIRGTPAKIIGVCCLLLGSVLAVFEAFDIFRYIVEIAK